MMWLQLWPSFVAFVAMMIAVCLGPTAVWWLLWGRD